MVLKPKLPHPVCILEVLMLVPGIIVAKHNAMQYNSEKKKWHLKQYSIVLNVNQVKYFIYNILISVQVLLLWDSSEK